MELYSCSEISDRLNITISSVYSRIYRNRIKYLKKKGSVTFYSLDQFLDPVKVIVKYYPLKTTETFYIYQSKINNQ